MTLSQTHGVITSPGFPQNYLDGTNCTWLIRLPLGQQIEINFLHFDFPFLINIMHVRNTFLNHKKLSKTTTCKQKFRCKTRL